MHNEELFILKQGQKPCSDNKPFFLLEKAVFSMRKSRSFYEKKPFFLNPIFAQFIKKAKKGGGSVFFRTFAQ